MNTRIAMFVAGLVVFLAATVTVVAAHHSYLLTVQQLKVGLTKAPSKAEKGFVLIDVRSPEEHLQGFIPGTDINIDFREMRTRHREIGAQLEDHIVVYCQSGQNARWNRPRQSSIQMQRLHGQTQPTKFASIGRFQMAVFGRARSMASLGCTRHKSPPR